MQKQEVKRGIDIIKPKIFTTQINNKTLNIGSELHQQLSQTPDYCR